MVRVLELLGELEGLPEVLVMDDGPEFAGQALDAWACERSVKLRFIGPGKPIQSAFIESFNGKFRDECRNEHWFVSWQDARAKIEAWRRDYNEVRPPGALGNRTQRNSQAPGWLSPQPPRRKDQTKPRNSHYDWYRKRGRVNGAHCLRE